MNKIARNLSLATLVGVVSPMIVACTKSPEPDTLLQYVPADTPYVIASTEPMPDKLADKLEPTIDEVLRAYQRIVRHAMAEKLVELSDAEDGAEKAAQMQGLVDEVLSLMSIEGIRNAGIERDSAFAFYGNGLLPVIRFELSDAAAFDAAIARIEDKAESKLSVGEVQQQQYKYLEFEQARLVIATLDGQAVISVVPSGFDEDQLALALGIRKPAKSLEKSEELDALSEQYGLSGYFTGYVNNERIAGTFLGEPTGLDKDLLDIFEYDNAELSDVCKSEFMEIVGIAPRLVFGYTEMNDKHIESFFIVELREDIASGLASLPRAVPGMGQDFGGLLSFGFSLDPMAARSFYEGRLDAMEADPFKCDKLAALQDGVAMGREALNKPVPPVVYDFRGILAVISDIQGMDVAQQKPPESMDASFLLAVENAESLVAMAAMMDPQFAALNLMPDGKPVKLEMAQLADIADEAFAALSEDAFVVSVGEGSEANARNLLVADSAEPAPFISMSMDTARYYGLIGETMMQAKSKEGEKEMPLAVRTALRDVMTLIGDVYKRMRLDVTLTPLGIEMRSRLILAD